MRITIFIVFFNCYYIFGQTVADCRARFDKYLNLKGSLNNSVIFEKDVIFLLNEKGEKEFAAYSSELPLLSEFFENSTIDDQLKLYHEKGIKKLSRFKSDSILISIDDDAKLPQNNGRKPLYGLRIAIDPGHFSSNLKDSKVEGKYLHFVKPGTNTKDSIELVEGNLTFLTAKVLKHMIEEQGAQVLLSRPEQNVTAFNMTYSYWYKHKRQHILDSLKNANELDEEKYLKLKKLTKEKLFWAFFRDYELIARSNRINAHNPHLTVIIHFNVDEKNSPWINASERNHTMCFIGGAFVDGDLKKMNNKLHFLRLLLGKQINQSEDIGHLTVNTFSKNLKVNKARPDDANYLLNKSISTAHDGVFCRNLILTRCINSPLVYGESLYQDNILECTALNECNYEVYGLKVPQRIYEVARSYYEAIMDYFIK